MNNSEDIKMHPRQKKNFERALRIDLSTDEQLNPVEIELVREIEILDEKIDTLEEQTAGEVEELNSIANEALKIASETSKKEGPAGYTPIKGVDYKDGENYVLTEADKSDIASKVKVPIVEKIVERVEKIIEQPIVTNQIVKEIKTEFDTTQIEKEISDLKEDFEKKISDLKKLIPSRLGGVFGGRAGIQVLGSSSKVGTKTNEINFGTGLTVTDSYGRITVSATSSGGTLVENEVLGTGDGSTKIFTLASTPIAGSVKIYAGGVRQILTEDYSVSGTDVTFVLSVPRGIKVIADYRT